MKNLVTMTYGTYLHADEISSDWTDDGEGIRLPPAEIRLGGEEYTAGTTAAASISHSYRRMKEEGILDLMPDGQLNVLNGQGGKYDTLDFACMVVPDSNARLPSLQLGPGFFPCPAGALRPACNNEADCCPSSDPSCGATCDNGLCNAPKCTSCVEDADCCPADSPDCDANCKDGFCVEQRCVPVACSADDECLLGMACMELPEKAPFFPTDACAGERCYCAYPPQSTQKYTVTHEFAHLVQQATMGRVTSGDYFYDCPDNFNCEGATRLNDPPGAEQLCSCDHVRAANGAHCLQSIEVTGAAQGEGFAHYFSSLMWNDRTGSCRFTYYKEVLDDQCFSDNSDDCECVDADGDGNCGGAGDLFVNFPPAAIDCGTPVRWRNLRECGSLFGAVNNTGDEVDLSKAKQMGTEWDWMTFLRDLHGTLSFGEIISVYQHACDLDSTPLTDPGPSLSNCPIKWEDALVEVLDRNSDGWKLSQRYGVLSGAERAFGVTDERYISTEEAGNVHGVSHDTTPLP